MMAVSALWISIAIGVAASKAPADEAVDVGDAIRIQVEVYPADDPQRNAALGKAADQKSVDRVLYMQKLDRKAAPQLAPPDAQQGAPEFLPSHTREVVGRARDLAARLNPSANPARLGPLTAELESIEGRLGRLEKSGGCPKPVRRDLYFQARWLARKIAFCNLALNMDKILFIKRHHPTGLFHMVFQYHGYAARPGGGLFILSDPFSAHPRLTNLLAQSIVQNGRLKGRRLTGGACLSPELSYDGRSILFAHSECGAQGVEWSPEASFHIFKMGADGAGLVQLTDGRWNDFDPCWLPNGRIAFISERRAGYPRCGYSYPPFRGPTYTLHSMAPDGGDIICLSYHETQEWQPSVNHEGMIVYTRWDYVDRSATVAHHLWTCYPDGRDPRSFHGNYPRRIESRPMNEMDIRAIPGSAKYVATAAPHHGPSFGSLITIDPRIEDDGAMSQIARLTPEVAFPEVEGGGTKLLRPHMVYGTPWPLSEDDYLCVHASMTESHGVCWIDRFGNRELIYRDPEIPCLSPIPLRPRPIPPVIPDATRQTLAAQTAPKGPATIAVTNVYDSDFTWPLETKIAALRIIQILPKTTPRADVPRIGVANTGNARAVLGVNVRLGTGVRRREPNHRRLHHAYPRQCAAALRRSAIWRCGRFRGRPAAEIEVHRSLRHGGIEEAPVVTWGKEYGGYPNAKHHSQRIY